MCRGRIRRLRQAGSEVSYLSNRSDLRLARHWKGNAVVTFARVAARNQCLSGRLPIEHATIDDLESTEANPEKEATADQVKMSGRFLILPG